MDTTIHNKFGDLLCKLKNDIYNECYLTRYELPEIMNRDSLLFKSSEEISSLSLAYDAYEVTEQIIIDRLENIVKSITDLGDDRIPFTRVQSFLVQTIPMLKKF
jgi:hypothetical protein